MRRGFWCIALGGLLALLLSGCGVAVFRGAEDLFAQPRLPERYNNLSETIQSVMSSINAEQTTPLSGSNTSAIQLLDLDGDKTEEAAAAFFRSNAVDDPQPLKIYLFRVDSDGTYQVAYTIQGEGNNINSIYYEDLNGDGAKEVVVSWQLTARANVLSVYALELHETEELARTTYNESYDLSDLNGDGIKELMIIQRDDTGEDHSQVSYYAYENETLMLASTANLSENVTDVSTVRTGVLAGQVPALYVTSECEGGRVTDIFACRDGLFCNVTLSADTRVSNNTFRSYTDINVIDINNDGVLEIPVSQTLPNVDPESTATYWLTYWRQFDLDGDWTLSCITYHSSDGWYLLIPSDWDGQIAVERNDSESYRGERAVLFYHQTRSGKMVHFMTVYRLTGNNRVAWAAMGDRELLLSTDSAAYSVEFFRDEWDCGLSVDQVRERFQLITTEWSTLDNT